MEVVDIKKGDVVEVVNFIDSSCDQCDKVFNVGKGAVLRYVEVAHSKGVISSKVEFNCDENCRVFVNTIDVDNINFKRDQVYNLNGRGSEVEVIGVYVVAKDEVCENNLKMNHFIANCSSKQIYKGVVDNLSSFNGHIYIAKDAQQSVALQQNNNVLLSDGAKAETKPWLEIYADDVKCNHGATVGKNDEEALFYMRQRGIEIVEAKKLLMRGFVEGCVGESSAKEKILELIDEKVKTL